MQWTEQVANFKTTLIIWK